MEYMGMADASAIINGDCCLESYGLLWLYRLPLPTQSLVFCNLTIFQNRTDTHILDCDGSLRSLITPIRMARIITHLVSLGYAMCFVFKKTIPFFWYPVHTPLAFLIAG